MSVLTEFKMYKREDVHNEFSKEIKIKDTRRMWEIVTELATIDASVYDAEYDVWLFYEHGIHIASFYPNEDIMCANEFIPRIESDEVTDKSWSKGK